MGCPTLLNRPPPSLHFLSPFLSLFADILFVIIFDCRLSHSHFLFDSFPIQYLLFFLFPLALFPFCLVFSPTLLSLCWYQQYILTSVVLQANMVWIFEKLLHLVKKIVILLIVLKKITAFNGIMTNCWKSFFVFKCFMLFYCECICNVFYWSECICDAFPVKNTNI